MVRAAARRRSRHPLLLPHQRRPRIPGPDRRGAEVTTVTTDHDVARRFRAMASDITVRVIDPVRDPSEALAQVEATFRDIERACTRFDDSSDLMRANAQPGEWTSVDPHCFAAIELANAAYERTGGAFDPRVFRTLHALGYDRSLNFSAGDVTTAAAALPESWTRQPWRPDFDHAGSRVRMGVDPLDLGGIGKGYAVRRGIELLAGLGRAALVEAGGDLATYGDGPEREAGEARGWRASVEDPRRAGTDAPNAPIAVLNVTDAAVATSSIKVRRWRAGDRDVHHLIDPRTGEPAASGLLSVTVIDHDPAWAEVWTKAAFLQGAHGISAFAEDTGLAALWVDGNGALGSSEPIRGRILWEAPDAR